MAHKIIWWKSGKRLGTKHWAEEAGAKEYAWEQFQNGQNRNGATGVEVTNDIGKVIFSLGDCGAPRD